MDKFLQDIGYGVGVIRKTPGISALIILIVAIGVGAAATIFSIVEKSLLWNENPNVDRWVVLRPFFPTENIFTYRFSAAEYFEVRKLDDVFESTGAIAGCNLTLYRDNYPELVNGACVSADMIPMTSIPPMLGRAFSAAEDKPGVPLTVVLTHELWQRRFHGDRGILGQSIRFNDHYYTIIGIMPAHYALWGAELYIPFQLDPANSNRVDRRAWISALIRRGISSEQVNVRLEQLAQTWQRDHLGSNPEYQGLKFGVMNVKAVEISGVRAALLILTGVVGLIIVISCANIGNLLLSRASGRRREMAVRTALGAPRWSMVRQLLTESLLLSLAGSAFGILLTFWGVPAVLSLIPASRLPYSNLIRVDSGSILLALAAATLMGLVFGLAPALYSVRGDLTRAVREGGVQSSAGREGRWMRGAFVVSQITLAMIVLVGAGLMIRTYRELLRIDIGINPHNVLTAQLGLPGNYDTPEKIINFHREIVSRVQAIPGVDGAATISGSPMMELSPNITTQDFSLPGHEGEKNVPNANLRVVTPQYFSVAGIPLLRGRFLAADDTATSEPVVLINQTMAKLFWPSQNPVGQSIRLGNHYGLEPGPGDGRWVKVVGVVADSRQERIIELPPRQEMFFPVTQRPELARAMTLMVRSHSATDGLVKAVRHAVAAVDPERPAYAFVTMDQIVTDSFGPTRMITVLLGFFAAVAITLASVGLYAIMAYSVAQRTREIGIRMALGASPKHVLRTILREGSRLGLLGLAGGIAGTLAATRLMQSLVFDVSTSDPQTLLFAGSLLAVVALVACYIPARRATRVDPIIALRCD